MTYPKISVLIPAYNEAELLPQTLTTVHKSFSALAHEDYEIIACNNASTDDTEIVAKAQGAHVILEPTQQIARARNTAASKATGNWFIFLDADTLVSPELLSAALDTLAQGRVAGGGAPLKFDLPKLPFLAWLSWWLWNGYSSITNTAAGSFIFCSRDLFEAVGGFDETYFVGEELFFSKRAKKWAKAHGQRFRVLNTCYAITSGRKIKWYGGWQIFTQLFGLLRPGAFSNKDRCGMWYTRPQNDPEDPPPKIDS